MRKFEIVTSAHGMPSIQIDPTPEERNFLKRAVLSQFTDCIFYQKKQDCSPFVQSDQPGFLLIEFWKGGVEAQKFVDFLNSDHPEVLKAKKFA